MNKILMFKLSKQVLSVKETVKDNINLNNTNIIDTKDIKFSTTYIKENLSLVTNFLNVIIIKNNINTVKVEDNTIAPIVMDLIKTSENITNIVFKDKEAINLELFFKIIDNKNIKNVECEDIASYLIERIDQIRDIKITTRNKMELKSNFIIDNLLNTYSDMYYKKAIVIRKEFTKEEFIDFKNFLGINNRLRLIKILYFSNEVILSIMKELKNHNKENIAIEILEYNNDLNLIYKTLTYIKKKYHKYIEDNNITFKLTYSLEYKKKNLLKEVNYRILKYSVILVFLLGLMVVSLNYYKSYVDQNKVNKEIKEFHSLLEENQVYKTIDDNESDIEYIDVLDVTTKTTKAISNYQSLYYTNFPQVFKKLLKKNKDTVGWLTVNETKINTPVVQSDANSYYLNHDFYKRHNTMGWIFMDYRNNIEQLDQNTIIYGHNIRQGLMFGTLKYTLNSSWYKKKSNQIITFNTINKNMKWKIFSIYKIPTTKDYLKNNFANDEKYLEFINKIQERSLYDFKVEVKEDDKILTLSTCVNDKYRTVLHAVLIDEENQES